MTFTIAFTFLFSILFPLCLAAWWKSKTGAKLWSFAVGVIIFPVFALLLEGMIHQVCLYGDNPIANAINGDPFLFVLYVAFAAGIFEETGRYLAFKFLLKKRNEKCTAVAYGIGHGGIEILIVLGLTYGVYFLTCIGVSLSGSELVDQQIVSIAQNIHFGTALVAIIERISAMMLHIGFSMFVFVAARDEKMDHLYLFSIFIHALVDAPAAYIQYTGTTDPLAIVFMEIFVFFMSIFVIVFGAKCLEELEEPVDIKDISWKLVGESESREEITEEENING